MMANKVQTNFFFGRKEASISLLTTDGNANLHLVAMTKQNFGQFFVRCSR